jgi:ABC-type nitrate/sulfonate/bicarbonate transport system substrate-binding protein
MLSHTPRLTRRAALGMAASAALVTARPRRARAAKTVSFTLPWVPEGANMIAYIARENGYWSDAGLDVTVSRGSGSVAAAQAIGAGRFDFGLSVASAGLQQAAKGLPVMQIACCSYDAMMGIAVRKDGPIKTPKDLEGHSIGSTTSSGEYPFLPAYLAAAGVDPARVQHVAADPNVRNSMFVQGKVDAVSGLAPTLVPTFEALGVPIRMMLFSQVGLRFYGNMLMTQASRLTADPATVHGITDGLMKATKFVLLNPDAALKTFLKAVPEIELAAKGVEQTRLGIGLFQVAMLDKSAQGHPLGYSDPATFTAMEGLVMQALAAPGDKMPAQVMSNDFIGAATLTPEEWAKADASAAEFRALVS